MPKGTWNDPFTLGGILDDPTQLNQLGQNPLFNMGMGLLASSYDPSVNPYIAAAQGLQTSRGNEIQDDELARAVEQRRRANEYFKLLMNQGRPTVAQDGMSGTGMVGDQNTNPFPTQDPLRDYVLEQAWKYQLGIGQ